MDVLYPYQSIAYYHFTPLEDPFQEVKRYKKFFASLDMKGRVYLSKEGINAQISIKTEEASEFLSWLKSDPRFHDAQVKIQGCAEHAFYKMTVKTRAQLVAFDVPVDLSVRGEYLTAAEWKEKLEKRDANTIVIDARNRYESEVGHFEGAIIPECDSFREFPNFTEELSKRIDPQKGEILMYCTGGIRCEYYSSYLKKKGFKNVYQLHGGVIQYGLEEGSKHWKGKLFVFDDRLVVPISEEAAEIVSKCHLCDASADTYYNCANMDCNALFLSCQACIEKLRGCCSEVCTKSKRVRAFEKKSYKPFRRWPFEEKMRWKNSESV